MKKILCVCLGNSDRSPVMAAVLSMYLESAGHAVVCESAGVTESAKKGVAGKFGVTAAKRFGLDISGRKRCHVSDLDLKNYDLIICAGDSVAEQLINQGADADKLYNAQINNPWPVQQQEQYDRTFEQILVEMARVMKYYFPLPSWATEA